MSKALLICNGQDCGEWLKKEAKEADFILAADGGADAALDAGIVPDAVIGDLDSASPRARKMLANTPFIHVSRQDNTDFEKALDWLSLQQFDSCTIAGATGGRMDFTLGNFLSVYAYLNKIEVVFQAENWKIYPLIKSKKFNARKGARMSIISLTPCQNITLKGVKYRLNGADWQLGQTGISNVITAKKTEVLFDSGYMLLYLED
ncbi:MAG: thiamine diphosphokinase [Elusimicrobiaceae bacterium]|nr:thiamine diphosphokinase [Elusimicrobiaceae bacterium]